MLRHLAIRDGVDLRPEFESGEIGLDTLKKRLSNESANDDPAPARDTAGKGKSKSIAKDLLQGMYSGVRFHDSIAFLLLNFS
jgi:hypothetical protein